MVLEEIKRAVSERVRAWARDHAAPEPGEGALPFTPPPPHVPADLSLPWPLQAAKALRKDPMEVAGGLARALEGLEGVAGPRASAPGFVNFQVDDRSLARNLGRVLKAPAEYGTNPWVRKRSILIEYVSANPTGPLHLASGRAATLGDSLVRILRRIGHKVWAEYYVNNAGNQVALLGQSARSRRLGQPLPEGGYQGSYIAALAEAAPAESASWTAERWSEHMISEMLKLHRADMEAFGVTFDRWYLETELHRSGAVQKTLEDLRSRGMAYEKEGAVWLGTASKTEEDDKDRVLVKSDGRPTYFLADIAYHKDKYDRGWEELIDIWGADHHGYVPRMKAAAAALGKPPEAFHAVIHQLVHLYRGKELVKMSKRAGEFVTLKELIEEVGKDACRFFFAQRTPNAHMNFDLELAKKQSQENPVYYVQYVHARICSIFREAAKSGPIPFPLHSDDWEGRSPFSHPSERALLVKLAWFPDSLLECARALNPSGLANYLLELAGLFHPFYEQCRVVDSSNRELSRARLALCGGIGNVIREGLGLLGVGAPESM